MTAATPRAPALTPKGRATRTRIVTAAAELMFAHGVARTSLDEVKAAAGVSSSQLYHYFEDKHALVSAVIEHQTEAVLAGQQPLLAALDSVAAFRAWRDVLVGFRRDSRCRGGCPMGSLGSELSDTDAHARRELAAGFRRWETSIANGLREMRSRGELLPGARPDDLALAVLAAAQGGILLAQIHRETRPLETALDTIIDHIESLVVRPPRPPKSPRRR
ncbi:MAG: TetR/AcrR family transcriptional regulator [Bacillota bacterium]|jgi:AcrR family transcriptional regulator